MNQYVLDPYLTLLLDPFLTTDEAAREARATRQMPHHQTGRPPRRDRASQSWSGSAAEMPPSRDSLPDWGF
jgi:hypothetical protein